VARHRRSSFFKLIFLVLVLAAVLAVSGPFWLPLFGTVLIHDDGPAKADLAVVLAGDHYGRRIQKAGDLVRSGFVPAALVSGPGPHYGLYESDVAIAFAATKGYPQASFISFRNSALSTRDEAAAIIPELVRRNVRSAILVTSDFHTARARRTFREMAHRLGAQVEMRTVAAPDEFFRSESWWRSRQGQKTVFIEWSKTVASAIGM
jgi:uncharacterized SAM-binding protein YcdF (DUF218 family)